MLAVVEIDYSDCAVCLCRNHAERCLSMGAFSAFALFVFVNANIGYIKVILLLQSIFFNMILAG